MKNGVFISLALLFLAFSPQNSSAQLVSQLGILDLSANGGINPHTMMPWAAGDTYRIVFVSSTPRDGTSSNIADYNMHVDTLASQAGLGDASIQWFAVLATPTVHADTNTMTTPGDTDGAFFLVDGTTVFSDSIADFWGSTTSSTPRPLDLTELNAAPTPVDIRSLPGACNGGFEQYRGVLTGVDVNGKPKTEGGQDVSIGSTNTRNCGPNTAPGCVQVGIWNGDDRNDKWISRGTQQDDCLGRVYAMSEVLRVLAPEIEVLGKGMSIADSVGPSMASGTDFGQVLKGEMYMDTFWIKNDGTDTLDISSIDINGISGSNATGAFTRSLIGAMVPVEVPNDPDSVALKVTFSPTVVGKDSVLITINNNDSDEPDFDLIIRAEGVMFMSTDTFGAGLMAVDPCSCSDPDNLTTGGGEFLFHDVLTVMGPPGLDLRLLINDMEFLDNTGTPLPINTTMIPETGAMTGIYQLDFWHRSGIATTITYGEAGGGGLMDTFTSSLCMEADCASVAIPTLSEWGLILLGLILTTIGLVAIRQRSVA